MAESYWSKYWSKTTNRRRLMGGAGVAGVGLAALGLVGCGDDDDNGGGVSGLATPTAGANAIPKAADPFAGAKKGGTHKVATTGDPPTIDPFGNLSFLTKGIASYPYSRLYMYKTGPGIKSADARPTGDVAESAENTPDGLKWTVKLRKGVNFHNVAPVNGRAVTTDDIKFSYGRATDSKNGNASQLTSFIDKVEFPDTSTVVFTLKAPNIVFLDTLADTNLLYIMPTEAEGKFDPSKTMIGSGPWIFDSYTPSQVFKFKKNPDWWNKGFPLLDAVEVAIIPEYATRLAQFRAGNSDGEGINPDDLVETKSQIKDLQLYGVIAQQNNYVYFDPDPASPWSKDDRVRQAISMAFDRDALTDLVYNTKKLKAGGIDVSGPWNNLIPAGMTRLWLDPQSKDQGETGAFFKYNVAEAKRLLSAAGYDNINTTYQYTANRYGKGFNDAAEASQAYLTAIGIKTTTDVQDYSSKYVTQTLIGNFKGIAFGLETPFPEGGSYPVRLFTDNPLNHSKITKDAELAKLTADQQKETNEEKRKQIFWDIQRANAKHMYYIPSQVGAGTGWTGYQGYVKNAVEFAYPGYGIGTESMPFRWLNK